MLPCLALSGERCRLQIPSRRRLLHSPRSSSASIWEISADPRRTEKAAPEGAALTLGTSVAQVPHQILKAIEGIDGRRLVNSSAAVIVGKSAKIPRIYSPDGKMPLGNRGGDLHFEGYFSSPHPPERYDCGRSPRPILASWALTQQLPCPWKSSLPSSADRVVQILNSWFQTRFIEAITLLCPSRINKVQQPICIHSGASEVNPFLQVRRAVDGKYLSWPAS